MTSHKPIPGWVPLLGLIILAVVLVTLTLTGCGSSAAGASQGENTPNTHVSTQAGGNSEEGFSVVYVEGIKCVVDSFRTSDWYLSQSISCDWTSDPYAKPTPYNPGP